MSKSIKNGASTFWVAVMTIGILACLGGVAYTFFMVQQEAGQEGEYRVAADEMRLLSQQVAVHSGESVQGQQKTFTELGQNLESFEAHLATLQSAGLPEEVMTIDLRWKKVRDSAQTLMNSAPRMVFINSVSGELEQNIKPIQSEFAGVVDILRDESVSSETIVAAQKTLWLTERIARNIDKILAGGAESQLAADEFRTDAADFLRIVDALNNGSSLMGVDRVTDADAIDSVKIAASLFSVVSTSIEQIAEASAELREAAQGLRERREGGGPAAAETLSVAKDQGRSRLRGCLWPTSGRSTADLPGITEGQTLLGSCR